MLPTLDMSAAHAERIQTVTELTRSIRGLLEATFPFVTVTGEISNLRQPASGHFYFTLKDAEAQIKAVLFRQQLRYLACTPTDGLAVLCRGRLSVYEPRGEYQLIIDYLDTKGAGALQIAFEQLKIKLASEGLFEAAHKKSLPWLPAGVALITSPTGAAVVDFVHVAARRFPATPITIYPVRVQGGGAGADIAAALDQANQHREADVIVLCRGGGSLEDLWAFNEEVVARAIFRSKIPVITAIGHEVDFTIADFVADARAATPTAAAELLLPDRRILKTRVEELRMRLLDATRAQQEFFRRQVMSNQRLLGDPTLMIAHFHLRLDHARVGLSHALRHALHQRLNRVREFHARLLRHSPRQLLQDQGTRTREISRHLLLLMRLQLERLQNRLSHAAGQLDAVSPLAVLARGYAVVRNVPDGAVIRSASQVATGDTLRVTLHQGGITCMVVDPDNSRPVSTPPKRRTN